MGSPAPAWVRRSRTDRYGRRRAFRESGRPEERRRGRVDAAVLRAEVNEPAHLVREQGKARQREDVRRRASFHPEGLGLEELGRDGGAVDGDERPLRRRA
jgi:hypothetical protein